MTIPRVLTAAALGVAFALVPAAFAQRLKDPGPQAKAASKAGVRADALLLNRQIERLDRMSPDERRRFIEQLPAERRRVFERRLQQYHSLTPRERERLARFQQMSPEERDHVRGLFRQFSELPQERRPLLRRELASLRSMSDDDRRARLASEEFRNRYSTDEQRLLAQLGRVLPDE